MSLGALLYGVPVYRESGSTYSVKVPLVKIHLYNNVIASAYSYLVYRFSQYAYLQRGFIIRNYDPTSGTIDVEVSEETHLNDRGVEDDVISLFKEFVHQYFVPRLTDMIRGADLDDLLLVFYKRQRIGEKQTGLASVVLPLRYVEQYIESIESNKWAIQRKSVDALLKKKDKILEKVRELRSKGLSDDDLVVVDKDGDIILLKIDELLEQLERISDFQDDLKFVSRVMKCCYCGSKINGLSFSATGRLGVGRYRLPQESKTDLSSEARVCLRCILISMYYILEGGEKMLIHTLNGLLNVIRAEESFSKDTTIDLAISLAKHMVEMPTEWTASMIMNSAFGKERVRVHVESLDEVAIERLALLAYAFPWALHNESVQRILLSYMCSNFSSFISYLVYVLKQSKKGGNMSYISKEILRYITPHLYKETELRIAYTIASIAEGLAYYLKQAGADNYTLRKFADTLSTGGLSTAIAYALQRLANPPIAVAISKFIDRSLVKEILDEYSFRYYEKDGIIYIYLDSIPLAEIKIRENHGMRVFAKAYELLLIMTPEIASKEKGREEQSEGETVA
ncbi:MAG: hypothetical protein QXW41_09080 [Fervidicoccaceae archaeon]